MPRIKIILNVSELWEAKVIIIKGVRFFSKK